MRFPRVFILFALAPMWLHGQSAWTLKESATPFVVVGKFEGGTEISGIAAISETECLLVSNETRCVQSAALKIGAGRIEAGAPIYLLDATSADEIDLEGVCANPAANCYYATGSHGVSKDKGKPRRDQAWAFRIPVDPATKRPDPKKLGAIKSVSLYATLGSDPAIKSSIGLPLQRNGLNIEGLAFRDGKLFIGLRSPLITGKAVIVETDAEELFSYKTPASKTHLVDLGAGHGIREITACRDAFLILSGNAGSEASSKFPDPVNFDGDKKFGLFLWQPGSSPEVRKIGVLPPGGGKAEGLLVLEETDAKLSVLVLFDGVPNGGPKVIEITKGAKG